MEEINPTPPIQEEEIAAIEEVRGFPTRILIWGLALVAAFVMGLGAGYMVWARPLEARVQTLEAAMAQAAEEQATAQAEQQAAGAQQVKRYNVPLDDDPIYGSQDAAITIIEFSDYECPFCRRWHQEVWPQIKAKYGNKVRLVYRDFPLYNIHPNAGPAAEAANCAGEQNRYWEFNERLFSGQSPLSRESYESHAKELNLDLADFQKCLDEQRYTAEVENDYTYAAQLGVRSTPTFFINGLAVVGAQPFEVFEQIIDMELAGEIPD